MVSKMATDLQKRNLNVSAEMQRDSERKPNPITTNQPDDERLNVQQDMVWVQMPCVVDSGACANISPEDMLADMPKDAPKL